MSRAEGNENNKQRQDGERSPVLEGGAEANAAVIQQGEQRGESESEEQVRQVDGLAGNAVQGERIEPGKDECGDAAEGDGFPGADDEVGEKHHPSSRVADG